jgi:hypothetical protein
MGGGRLVWTSGVSPSSGTAGNGARVDAPSLCIHEERPARSKPESASIEIDGGSVPRANIDLTGTRRKRLGRTSYVTRGG